MKKTKILTKHKSRMQDPKTFFENYQEELNQYLNEGYEIKASNITNDNIYLYVYTLLEKEEVE